MDYKFAEVKADELTWLINLQPRQEIKESPVYCESAE